MMLEVETLPSYLDGIPSVSCDRVQQQSHPIQAIIAMFPDPHLVFNHLQEIEKLSGTWK